ncbi:heptahelical transmembrane protein2, partial [Prunus dulcis]
ISQESCEQESSAPPPYLNSSTSFGFLSFPSNDSPTRNRTVQICRKVCRRKEFPGEPRREMCNHGKREESETKKQQKVKSVKKKMTLMKFQDLPQYMKDNEFILDYYRCEWPLNDVVFSLFAWHNETLNIWTHLVGFLIFVGLTVMSLRDDTELGGLLGNLSR